MRREMTVAEARIPAATHPTKAAVAATAGAGTSAEMDAATVTAVRAVVARRILPVLDVMPSG